MIEPTFILKTTIGIFEVSTVNLRGRDDWYETLVFNNATGHMTALEGRATSVSTSTTDEAWEAHKEAIGIVRYHCALEPVK